MSKEIIITGKWDMKGLDSLLQDSCMISEPDEQIEFLSRQFLGIPYKENTLIGSMNTTEIFVINLESVDCLTFIEDIEAMRLSGSFAEIKSNLKKIRYRDAIVDYQNRNHFFTDWLEYNSEFVEDVTLKIGGGETIATEKMLNIKEDESYFLPGITPRFRKINYIPSAYLDDTLTAKLKTGDYIGIYSEQAGLDVSHVGIFVKSANIPVFRHASSERKHRYVIDQDFRRYISGKPGIVVLRPRRVINSVCL